MNIRSLGYCTEQTGAPFLDESIRKVHIRIYISPMNLQKENSCIK